MRKAEQTVPTCSNHSSKSREWWGTIMIRERAGYSMSSPHTHPQPRRALLSRRQNAAGGKAGYISPKTQLRCAQPHDFSREELDAELDHEMTSWNVLMDGELLIMLLYPSSPNLTMSSRRRKICYNRRNYTTSWGSTSKHTNHRGAGAVDKLAMCICWCSASGTGKVSRISLP